METVGTGLIGFGFLAGPLALPLLIGAVWSGRWSLWAVSSLLLLWGAASWGLGVAQFAAIDSAQEARDTLTGAIASAAVVALVSAAIVGWRRKLGGAGD